VCCRQYSKRLQTGAVNVSPQSRRSPAIQVRANALSAIRLLKRCALASSRSRNGDVTRSCRSPSPYPRERLYRSEALMQTCCGRPQRVSSIAFGPCSQAPAGLLSPFANFPPPLARPAGRLGKQIARLACGPGGLSQWDASGSELGRQVAVDFESDADFHECGSCPVHSRLPTVHNGQQPKLGHVRRQESRVRVCSLPKGPAEERAESQGPPITVASLFR
jgi:hypothetical protein